MHKNARECTWSVSRSCGDVLAIALSSAHVPLSCFQLRAITFISSRCWLLFLR